MRNRVVQGQPFTLLLAYFWTHFSFTFKRSQKVKVGWKGWLVVLLQISLLFASFFVFLFTADFRTPTLATLHHQLVILLVWCPQQHAKKTKQARAPSSTAKCRQRKVIQADAISICSNLEPEPELANLSKTKHGCIVKTLAAPDEAHLAVAVPHLIWTDECIDLVITWCEDNPEDHQKLFSDITQAAKDQSHWKLVLKNPKLYYHTKIATHVFSVNVGATVCADFKKNPTCYVKSADNLLTRFDSLLLIYLLQIKVSISWSKWADWENRCRFEYWWYCWGLWAMECYWWVHANVASWALMIQPSFRVREGNISVMGMSLWLLVHPTEFQSIHCHVKTQSRYWRRHSTAAFAEGIKELENWYGQPWHCPWCCQGGICTWWASR